MILGNHLIKRIGIGFLVLAFALTFAMPKAHATTYYYQTTGYGNDAYIQSLIQQLNTLLAQLQKMRGDNYNGDYHKYYFDNGTPKKKTYSDGNSYDIEVSTEDADAVDDETVELIGEVELDDAPYADVWFEYGTDGDLDEETDSDRVTDDEQFEIEVDDIDEDDKYYFRAVAQDPRGYVAYGRILSFEIDDSDDDDDDNDDDVPEADTEDAESIGDQSAELHGTIDMNDFEDGIAFFVYGEDESEVEDVEDEDMYSDISEDGDDLQKVLLTSSLDEERSFWSTVFGLNEDTEYFHRICVEFEDEDGDETLECGDVESFTTDED